MKKYACSILALLFLFTACSVKKKLEINAPFELGEPFGQEWSIEGHPDKTGYDVILPIVSLNEDDAVLHNFYHKNRMAKVEIEMWQIGMVAVARFTLDEGQESMVDSDNEPFPFQLGGAEGVLSYLQKDKVRYIKVNGIQKNPVVSYPSLAARQNQ